MFIHGMCITNTSSECQKSPSNHTPILTTQPTVPFFCLTEDCVCKLTTHHFLYVKISNLKVKYHHKAAVNYHNLPTFYNLMSKENDNCIGLKLAMTFFLCHAPLCAEHEIRPYVLKWCNFKTGWCCCPHVE